MPNNAQWRYEAHMAKAKSKTKKSTAKSKTTKTVAVSPRAIDLAGLINKNPKTIDWMLKKLKVAEPKTVYRYLHQLHENGFDVCRRGFEHFGDIVYSVDALPKGTRLPRKKR